MVPSPANTSPAEHWYLAYSKPRQEAIAVQQLQNQGYLTYAPLCPVRRKPGRPKPADASPRLEPMFPRYVFLRPGREGQTLTPVRSTRGVCTLVSFGLGPVEVPPEVIANVRVAEQLAHQQNPLGIATVPVGSFVRLADERLQALQGLVTAVSGERITILLNILGREKALTVAHEEVVLC